MNLREIRIKSPGENKRNLGNHGFMQINITEKKKNLIRSYSVAQQTRKYKTRVAVLMRIP